MVTIEKKISKNEKKLILYLTVCSRYTMVSHLALPPALDFAL